MARSVMCFIGWLIPGPAHVRPHFFFTYNNRNHRRLLEGAEELLRMSGETTLFVPSDHMWKIMFRARRGDVVAVCCDWSPNDVGQSMALLKWKGVQRVGLQEGIRPTMARKYIWIDHFLAWGHSTLRATKCPARIVGSPTVERIMPRLPATEGATGRALINKKANAAWLERVEHSCRAAGLLPVVSGHHTQRYDPRFTTEDFQTELRTADVLVTPASTTVYEAIVCGVPVVLTANEDSDLRELSEHGGAYEVVGTEDDLTGAIRRAVDNAGANASERAAFLARNVSIDRDLPAPRRIAEALAEIGGIESRFPGVVPERSG